MSITDWKKVKNTKAVVSWKNKKNKKIITLKMTNDSWKIAGIGNPMGKKYSKKIEALRAVRKHIYSN